MLLLLKCLMGKCDNAALTKEFGVFLVLDNGFTRARFKIREEFFITVDLSRRR